MKKMFLLFMLTCAFSVFFVSSAYADATIDSSNVAKGIVVVNVSDASGKVIKAMVEKGGEKYVYTVIKSTVNLPLQLGTGEYKVSVLENVSGDKYKPLASQAVTASSIDEKEMYKASIPIVEYSVSTKAIPAYKALATGKTSQSDILTTVYSVIVKDFSYDFDKAATVQNGASYVPVIDTVYAAKKGICYDYAAVLGGALRSMGIPTRLVMGYVPEISEYHAWNEVLIDGKWIAVDATYDSQVVKAGKSYTMEKDKSKTKVLKTY